jgi:uracil-DNA glycosylase
VPHDPAATFDGALQEHFARLPAHWREPLAPLLAAASTLALADYIGARCAAGSAIFPPQPLAALHDCGPRDVRVVVLGQDPYHGPGQAHGFAFSVPEGVRRPPSLRNIQRELARDCGGAPQEGGSLLGWSRQGVLLLNCVLTVERGLPGSHARRGWEGVTDAIIDIVAAAPGPRAFLLWGAYAQARRARIEAAARRSGAASLVLEANHPSPLSARRPPLPFLGCGHFSRTNRHLVESGLAPIDWYARA